MTVKSGENCLTQNLTESSKSPASIAKSNKQWVGTQTSGEVSWKDCPTIDYRCRYKSGKYPGL